MNKPKNTARNSIREEEAASKEREVDPSAILEPVKVTACQVHIHRVPTAHQEVVAHPVRASAAFILLTIPTKIQSSKCQRPVVASSGAPEALDPPVRAMWSAQGKAEAHTTSQTTITSTTTTDRTSRPFRVTALALCRLFTILKRQRRKQLQTSPIHQARVVTWAAVQARLHLDWGVRRACQA